MVVDDFLWFYLVCSCYVKEGENLKFKALKRICRRQLLLESCLLESMNCLSSSIDCSNRRQKN